MEPQVIDGKYQIVRQLGKGGMGAVYEAKNLETGRRVAVKVIASELIEKSPEALSRFKREAKAAGALETQHVAQILDAGQDPATGAPYIVMEMLSGEDLKQLVRRVGPLAPDLALRIAAQACVGLQAAHDAGIIHRDIKSANLYLARRDSGEVVVKILDFGIAKVVTTDATNGDTTDLTSTGTVLGSPRYMSPEQARGFGGVSPRSDLWSLGVVLYEMLTGATPQADVDGMYGIVIAICTMPAPSVRERAPWASPEHAALVEKALQIDPAKRFSSAAEMLDDVRALLPDGTSIHESMLVPLPRELAATASRRHGSSPPSRSHASGETPLNSLRDRGGTGIPSGRSLLSPLLALSLLLAGGALVYRLTGSNASVAHADKPVLAPLQEPPASAPPASPAPPAPASEERTVRLSVEPADATAEVDGRATPVKDGGVDVRGALGSAHHVRIARGAQEATAEVAITAAGAVPSSLQVGAPAPKGPPVPPAKPYAGGVSRGGAPASTASAAPETKPKVAPPATTFE